jgi:hypothetical protein
MEKNLIVISKKREILNRAVVDPIFRKELFSRPEEAIKQFNLSEEEEKLILSSIDKRMYRFLESIDDKISLLSESVLCSGGGCGIA